MGIRSVLFAAAAAMSACGAASAIEVQNLEGFERYFGRYAPGGDCTKQPQVVIDREGFAFTGGPALPKATRPEYAASYMGNYYQGIGHWFFPYPVEPRPYVLTIDADETPGKLALEVFEFDYRGGPKLPDKYRPYLAASPYAKCR